MSVPGATLQRLTNLVGGMTVKGRRSLDVSGYSRFLYHVGTNNIGQTTLSLQKNFQSLVQVTRQRCPSALIFISNILPRPIDMDRTLPQVKEINTFLEHWGPLNGIIIINSFRLFSLGHYGARMGLFDDLLHLNSDGIKKLKDRFGQAVTQLR